MNKIIKLVYIITGIFLTIYLTSFYGVVFYVRKKIGYWPRYDNPTSGNFKLNSIEYVIYNSLFIFIFGAIILTLLLIANRKFLHGSIILISLIAFLFFQLYLNPFFEWFMD